MWSHNTLWYSFSFPDTWWYRAYFLLSIDHLYILLRNVYLGHLSHLHQIIILSCCKIGFLIYFNSCPVLNIWFAYIFLLIHIFLFIVFQCFFYCIKTFAHQIYFVWGYAVFPEPVVEKTAVFFLNWDVWVYFGTIYIVLLFNISFLFCYHPVLISIALLHILKLVTTMFTTLFLL